MGNGSSRIHLNLFFEAQATTGQQRFAKSIADRLLTRVPDIETLRPMYRSTSRAAAWLELQTLAPLKVRDGLLVSLTARTPVGVRKQIITVHDLFPLTHPEWFSRKYATLHAQLLRHNLRHASGIITVSEPVRFQIESLTRSSMPVIVAPNAPFFTPSMESDITTSLAVPKRFYLTVGSLEPRKNLPRLIDAYSRLPKNLRINMPLLIVGGQSDIFAEAGWTRRPTDQVRFLGRVTDADLHLLYRQATVLVSASIDEGFGLPLVEAAAQFRGTYAVSDIPVYRWVLGETSAEYFDATSVSSIAEKLQIAADSEPDVVGTRGLSTRFTWDQSAEIVADFILRTAQQTFS